jgi:1,4-alpha-glucan branching enzyme
MQCRLTVHYEAPANTPASTLLYRNGEGAIQTAQPCHQEDSQVTFEIEIDSKALTIKFATSEQQEPDELWRRVECGRKKALAIWCRGWHPFVHTSQPQAIAERPAADLVADLHFPWGQYISETGGRFGLGANPLRDGGVLFGLFHPHAARVYVTGSFNDWQHPGVENGDSSRFVEMTLHRGYFDLPNVWLARVDQAQVGDEYQFYIVYDMQVGKHSHGATLVTDPYARCFGADFAHNNAKVVDAGAFPWEDEGYRTPPMHEVILYELHVHGFTHGHDDVPQAHQGTYQGIIDRLHAGYFEQLGVTALYLMPLAEAPTPQGANALGYNTSIFTALERDYGTPDDLRRMVNEAHKYGLAVVVDQVFNHTANEFNPLWKLILDHPDEWERGEEGGLYFSGSSPWGNRTATERVEMQNMLIDACKQMVVEYHIDGFRFDYTHSSTMHHDFLNRLADELQALKPDILLIAENMPNESDLNRQGYNGFAQWHDHFHDGIKALLREGPFEAMDNDPQILGEMFYFSKRSFAAHTNNVVNYCESHDEHSVPLEVATGSDPNLNTPAAKTRKALLGFGASLLALGQPMIYMGQEFAVERERNLVYYPRPSEPMTHDFFRWASAFICLRRRYPALKLHGYDPIADGQFEWIAGPWLDERHGAGKRVIGWHAVPNDQPFEQMVILLNFENHPVEIDLELGLPGVWLCLANIDRVNDIPPEGQNSLDSGDALRSPDGRLPGFVLPDSSLFVYKYSGAAEIPV